jgi:23S rRNA pseudouridine955/2504/2580 synthase
MESQTTWTVPEAEAGQRLDRWLKAQAPEVPYVAWQKMLRQGQVRVNGRKAQAGARLAGGDVIQVAGWLNVAPAEAGEGGKDWAISGALVRDLRARVVFEDAALWIVNKPAGLAAQAGSGVVQSLDRALAAMFGADRAPKLVHRLDRETTGLIVAAKNRTHAANLTAQFAARTPVKQYLALVVGAIGAPHGRIDAPLGKVGAKAVVQTGGDVAVTTWQRVVEFMHQGQTFSVLLCRPKTGRMNQIRVHLAHVGHPLVGDGKYGMGEAVKRAGRVLHEKGNVPLYLHAWELQLRHPVSGVVETWQAGLPEWWEKLPMAQWTRLLLMLSLLDKTA